MARRQLAADGEGWAEHEAASCLGAYGADMTRAGFLCRRPPWKACWRHAAGRGRYGILPVGMGSCARSSGEGKAFPLESSSIRPEHDEE